MWPQVFYAQFQMACGVLLAVGLTACAAATPAPTVPVTDSPVSVVATKPPLQRSPVVFPTLAPTVTRQRQFTPTASEHGANLALPTATVVWVNGEAPLVVELSNYAFKPNRLAVWAGEPVTLIIRNVDIATAHLFEIAGLNVSVVVSAYEEKTVTFTATQPGVYDFTCPLDTGGVNHAMVGMIGELQVENRP